MNIKYKLDQYPVAQKINYLPPPPYKEGLDYYHWMRLHDDQKNAEISDDHTKQVLEYLESENEYTQKVLNHTKEFQDHLYNEMVGRIKQTDMNVPYYSNGYFYITRYEEGKEYPIYSRKKNNLSNPEEIMLNVNELAKDHAYFVVKGQSVSPNNRYLAYGEDNLSRRIYTLRFKDLETGEYLVDTIPNTSGDVVWANDNKTVFYSVMDETLRPYKIFKHIIGQSSDNDEEVFHEDDETFLTFVYKTKSQQYIVIGSYATLSQEYRYLNANKPEGDFVVFQPRIRNLEYSIYHFHDKWYVRNNQNAKNFKLSIASETNTRIEHWQDLIPHRSEVLLEDVDVFNRHLVLSERIDGLSKLRIITYDGDEHYIPFDEEAYMAYTGINRDMDTDVLRIGYTSLTTPNTVYDYNMKERTMTLMKQEEVVGSFSSEDYHSSRLMVKVRDGVTVPVSLVHHIDTPIDGSAPCLLYGYGSYGHSMDAYFSSVRLSLLDRGFIFAIAHIRGGEEMGRHWYEDGKLLKKKNTFYDFIDCGQYLIDEKYCAPDQLFAFGGSAGGLLMGVVINEAPQLWKGVVAAVPFVDVLNTMLDESIPLTTGEFDEWGNPKDEIYYDYIKTYSPYENVKAQDYPALLVTTGYHDSQVQYWEPAKWVAKLREYKTDNQPLLLHTNLEAGHGGASGRFRKFKETALEYAFLLDLADKIDQSFKQK
ncbi:S9 family peptidase [Membranihabitans marinus]|uniref:S9 family peptidase n=1 Tax=Membranihabitans marinus TaxID=1227546 RepID=UPI001F291B1D|nr:S9 family peptidase [Membranihabitans marinus]